MRIRVEGHKNQELKHSLKELERKFGVGKTLMERQAYQAQLDVANISYEKGQEAMMDLMARPAQEYDRGRGEFMPN